MDRYQLLTLCVTAFVALIGLFQFLTARQQWRTANNRAVLDLFERRYQVYNDVREAVRFVVARGTNNDENTSKVAQAAEQAKFIFGDDVVSYLDQIYTDMSWLTSLASEFEALDDPAKRKANITKQREYKDRIQAFRVKAPALFGPYMRFDQRISAPWLLRLKQQLGRGRSRS